MEKKKATLDLSSSISFSAKPASNAPPAVRSIATSFSISVVASNLEAREALVRFVFTFQQEKRPPSEGGDRGRGTGDGGRGAGKGIVTHLLDEERRAGGGGGKRGGFQCHILGGVIGGCRRGLRKYPRVEQSATKSLPKRGQT